MTKCPVCGGKMIREIRLVKYNYKNKTIQIEQPGEWCSCAEGILTPDDVKATEKALLDFQAQRDM